MIPHVKGANGEFEDDLTQLHDGKDIIHVPWWQRVLLNGPLKVLIALVLTAILVPMLIYQLAFYSARRLDTDDGYSRGTCIVARESRIPCGLGKIADYACHPECCYDYTNGMCFHRFPSRFSYVMEHGQEWTEELVLKPRILTVPFNSQNSLPNVRLSLDDVSISHLTITYYNSDEYSFSGRRIESYRKDYKVEVSSEELNVKVISAGKTIYNTRRGPLIAAKNIWEISFRLTDGIMFGFGEIPIKPGTVKIIYNHRDGMDSLPLIFAKTNSTYHGMLIDATAPTEVTFLEDNIIVVRSITNFGLKFHLFVGPKPSDIMKDVRKLIGFKQNLEYWMLGVHFCREYEELPKNTNELSNFIQTCNRQNLPFESHCFMPITFNDECGQEPIALINSAGTLLQRATKRYVPHVSPYIHYEVRVIEEEHEEGTTVAGIVRSATCNSTVDTFEDEFLRDSNTTLYIGSVGGSTVVYPNYENITDELIEKIWGYNKNIHGIILENSWPLDETERLINETKYHLPYFSEHFEEAFRYTPNWNTTKSDGEKLMHTHNEYSNHFAAAFDKILDVPAWVTSPWMNGDVFVNRQNITTSWTNLHKELTDAALGGISGLWYWSSPICGDTNNFDMESHLDLCVKWYMAATYLPMIKADSKGAQRDPLSFQGTHRSRIIDALKNRMVLALYFFTVLQEGPLLRPMFYEFPESEVLEDITSQFSVGSDLLIVPNLLPNQAVIHMRLPPGTWYELWSGLIVEGNEGEAVTMATTDADFFTAIRGGSIVPLQRDVKLSADLTRLRSDISLTVALSCEEVEQKEQNSTICHAKGKLFVTENVTIQLEADDTELTLSNGNMNTTCAEITPLMRTIISDVNIYGLNDTMNNYDTKRRINTSINLCNLDNGDITVRFLDD